MTRALALSALLIVGCAGYRAPTYSTLAGVVEAAGAARDLLPAACEKAQDDAVSKAPSATAARIAVHEIQARCEAALTGTEAVAKVARTARDGVRDVSDAAATPHDMIKWALGAIDAYKNLSDLLAVLGVQAPHVPGVN